MTGGGVSSELLLKKLLRERNAGKYDTAKAPTTI